jgi:hypothetical protein
MPPRNPMPIAAGAHQDCILAEGDRVVVHSGLILFARAERPGDEAFEPLERERGKPVDRAGWHFLLNAGVTEALVSIVRMGRPYARLRRMKKRQP